MVARIFKHDLLLVVGNVNASVGCDKQGIERAIRKHGLRIIKQNEERLMNLYLVSSLVLGCTLFTHKDIHKETWNSADGKKSNQITSALA